MARPNTISRTPTTLREDVRTLKMGSVDRERGIVHDVRVLGLRSTSWNRRYTPECLQEALHLYDGARVKVNHPPARDAHKPRSPLETCGWLEHPYIGSDGAIYADLCFSNPKSDLAESVMNAAERNPRLYGLSHNARSDGNDTHDADGTQVIHGISDLHSVDLVDDPSTNTSLFEGRKVTTTIKELLESATHIKPKTLVRLLEMGPDMGGAYTAPQEAAPPVDPAAGAGAGIAPPEENARDTLAKALMLLLKSGDPGDHKLAIQLMKIMAPKATGSSMGNAPETPPELDGLEEDDAEGGGEEDVPAPNKPPVEESRRKAPQAATVTLTEADAKGLCELSGVKATPAALGLMTGRTLTEARAVLELAKGATPGKTAGSSAPRSTSPGGKPLVEGKLPQTAADQAKTLLG